jgi:hypothetical protein
MKKIKTTIGYLCLPDESTVKTATVPFNKTNSPKEINMIIITSADSKRLYRTATPYGVGYTDCFDCIIASHRSRMNLTVGKSERKIDFLEIS